MPCRTHEWRKRLLFTGFSKKKRLTNKRTPTSFSENFDKNYSKRLGCQIVWSIKLVPNCPFAFLLPNCLFLLSWCQFVRSQIVLPPFMFYAPPLLLVRTEQAYAMDGRAVLFDYPPRLWTMMKAPSTIQPSALSIIVGHRNQLECKTTIYLLSYTG